jgi:NhaP-type Na+/H+ or K+/H+ antiporter
MRRGLFNEGMGVVVFIVLLELAGGGQNISAGEIGPIFLPAARS